jgi:hypothetical protein
VVWKQGEHVAIIGDTGSGKTYLENALGDYRSWWMFFRTKRENPRDDPMDRRWRRVRSVADIDTTRSHWLIDPRPADRTRQGYAVLRKAAAEGQWTVAIDELFQSTLLGLQRPIEELLTTGRSAGISVVCGMQRPVGVTRYAQSQCTHAFIFTCEGRDVKTLMETFTPRIKEAMAALNYQKHEFIYYNRRTRELTIARAQQLGRVLNR